LIEHIESREMFDKKHQNDEEYNVVEDDQENIKDFLKNNFEIYEPTDVKNICNRIVNEKTLPHLPYINKALERKGYQVDNKGSFFK
jgi:hypothetical protein